MYLLSTYLVRTLEILFLNSACRIYSHKFCLILTIFLNIGTSHFYRRDVMIFCFLHQSKQEWKILQINFKNCFCDRSMSTMIVLRVLRVHEQKLHGVYLTSDLYNISIMEELTPKS